MADVLFTYSILLHVLYLFGKMKNNMNMALGSKLYVSFYELRDIMYLPNSQYICCLICGDGVVGVEE